MRSLHWEVRTINWTPADILSILDACCDAYTFPMLDNGYVYLAATRLSLYRSSADWAMVIEVFGFSPRAGLPDNAIQTFASVLYERDPPDRYVDRSSYQKYLARNPHNEFRAVHPIEDGPWQNEEEETVAENADGLILRGRGIPLPKASDYKEHGIELEKPPHVQVFELCRLLAATHRAEVLATETERGVSVLPEMKQILQLEEWRHPDLLNDERPSTSDTFRQLAEVLITGEVARYRPSPSPNTHWKHWPDGGTL